GAPLRRPAGEGRLLPARGAVARRGVGGRDSGERDGAGGRSPPPAGDGGPAVRYLAEPPLVRSRVGLRRAGAPSSRPAPGRSVRARALRSSTGRGGPARGQSRDDRGRAHRSARATAGGGDGPPAGGGGRAAGRR